MEYQRQYRLPTNINEFLLVSWTKGYGNITVHFRDELLKQIDDLAELRKGITFDHEMLGKIKIQLNSNPFFLSIIVDGYHSPDNLTHPINALSSIKVSFMPALILNIFGAYLNSDIFFSLPTNYGENFIYFLYYGIGFLALLIGYLFMQFKKTFGYYLNGIILLIQLALPLFAFTITFAPEFLILSIFFLSQVLFSLRHLKKVISIDQHKARITSWNPDVID